MSSSRIEGGGVMISVTDQGVGMTLDELTQANRRLANPQAADASVARRSRRLPVRGRPLPRERPRGFPCSRCLPRRPGPHPPGTGGRTRARRACGVRPRNGPALLARVLSGLDQI
ncbi:hypothetical protein [Streptosporangium sp. CA-115845]|uniref:hypothetical protein n=1 Tax=Streptosporangium sp. CA-115845 TaxID=3240071 RepID=UPI003D8C35D4